MAEYISREDALWIASLTNASEETKERLQNWTAADVQPIKHGRWVWVKNYRDCEGDIYSQYKCSCCDFGVGGVYSFKDLTHFCGGCGARMDGDKE